MRKFLKGERPDVVSQNSKDVTIKSKSGNQITVDNRTFNIYESNDSVNQALSGVFEAVRSDPSIESFEMESKGVSTKLMVTRDEFEDLSEKVVQIIPEENLRIIEEPATLYIVKIVFDKNRKWEFLYRGNKISAYIEDESFYKNNIDGGDKFAKGDSLLVDLQIQQKLDNSVNAFVNSRYSIVKVRKHNRRPDQGSLSV